MVKNKQPLTLVTQCKGTPTSKGRKKKQSVTKYVGAITPFKIQMIGYLKNLSPSPRDVITK